MKALILTEPQVEINGAPAEVIEVINNLQIHNRPAEPGAPAKTKRTYRNNKSPKAKKSGRGKTKKQWKDDEIDALKRGI